MSTIEEYNWKHIITLPIYVQPLQCSVTEVAMITTIVRFPLLEGTSLGDAKAMFERSVPNYKSAPGLIRKYYLYGADRTGGGVYLWENREAADRQFSPQWRNMIEQKFGSAPEITYYETPVIIDNNA
jgi:hypothetical protein